MDKRVLNHFINYDFFLINLNNYLVKYSPEVR